MPANTSKELEEKFLKAFGIGQEYRFVELSREVELIQNFSSDPDPEIRDQAKASALILTSMLDFFHGSLNVAFESLFTSLKYFPKTDRPTLRAGFLSMISWLYYVSGAIKESKSSLKISNHILEDFDYPIIKLSNLFTSSIINSGDLKFTKILDEMTEAELLAEELGLSGFSVIARNNRYWDMIPFEPYEQLEKPILNMIADCEKNNPAITAYVQDTLARFYLFHGKWEDAIQIYNGIFDHPAKTPIPFVDIELLINYTEALVKTQKFGEAEKWLLQALKWSHQYDIYNYLSIIHKNLANLYTHIGKEAMAIDHLLDQHNITEKINNAEFLIKTIDPSLFSHPVDPAEMQEITATIGIDPQTGLLDRTRFVSIASNLLDKGLKNQIIMLIRISDGHIYKPRSIPRILSDLANVILEVIDDKCLACRYTKNDIVLLFDHQDLEIAQIIGKNIFNKFIETTSLSNEPWISAFINIGIIQGLEEEDWIIETIERLEREIRKKVTTIPGEVYIY